MDPSARKINTAKFQFKRVSVLVVTDVAARGIDIPSLDYVVNVHFPGKPKLFVHRVGNVFFLYFFTLTFIINNFPSRSLCSCWSFWYSLFNFLYR